MSVQINKIDENTYAIENLEDTQIIYELCELFNIKVRINNNLVIISDVTNMEPFNKWRTNLPHPKIDYIDAENVYQCFATTSLYLEKLKLQFSHLSADNIIVINGTIFIPTNTTDLYPIRNGQITINHPYSQENPYLSLELKGNDAIPYTVSFKCFYSSLGLLIYDLLIGLEETDYQKGILVLYMTKLYWILYYSLLGDTEERFIVGL